MEGSKVAEDLAGQVPKYLEGLDFPAPKKDIVGQAQKEQANGTLVDALEKLPEGVYNSVTEVAEHVTGKHQDAQKTH